MKKINNRFPVRPFHVVTLLIYLLLTLITFSYQALAQSSMVEAQEVEYMYKVATQQPTLNLSDSNNHQSDRRKRRRRAKK